MNSKDKKMTIYLVRHAQSSGNVDMSIDKGSDTLTDRGKVELNLLGMHLSQVKFDYAYTSDLVRAKCTADGILRHSKLSSDIPLQQEKRLREVDFGIYEKKSYQETYEFCSKLNIPPTEWYFPEGESFPECGERILKFLEDICKQVLTTHQNEDENNSLNVLVVSHTAGILNFLNILQQTQHELIGWNPKDLKLIRNANYMKFEVQRKSSNGEDAENKDLFQFTFLEKYFSKHLDCINQRTGLDNQNVLAKFAHCEATGHGKQFIGCVQQ